MTSICRVFLVALSLAFIAFPASAVPLYRATRLDFAATALNNRGEIVGVNGAGAVLWRNGKTQQLDTPSAPIDINDRGTVLGATWLWNRGGLVEGLFSGAVAINNRGEVAGDLVGDRAFTWDRQRGVTQIRMLFNGGLEERWFHVGGIADDGTVLLRWDNWSDSFGVWRSETDYARLPGVFDGCCLNTNAVINGHGDIAGISITGADPQLEPELPPGVEDCGGNGCDVIVAWTPDLTPAYIGLHGLEEFPRSIGRSSGATGINADLLVVGSYFSFELQTSRPYVGSADMGLLDLNTLLTNQARLLIGGELSGARGINDRGWIIVGGPDTSYLLRPVPEPDSVALALFAGFILVVVQARAKRQSVAAIAYENDVPAIFSHDYSER